MLELHRAISGKLQLPWKFFINLYKNGEKEHLLNSARLRPTDFYVIFPKLV